MTKDNNQPVYIYSEGTQRNQGRNAQRMNILAAKLVSESIRTTLGPKGMDKMLVDSLGEITVTNDGVTILREMDIDHPSAKMIVEIAKTQEEEVGDGTTTAVIIAGELLKNAEDLLDQNIHPTVIAKGYRLAADKAIEVLNKISLPISFSDKALIQKIGETAMTGKGAEDSKHHLSKIIVNAATTVATHENNVVKIDKSNIKIEKKTGGNVDDSELIEGIVLDKEKVNSGMPSSISGAKIALIETAIEIKSPETDAKISITDPEKIQGFIDMEESMLKKQIQKIVASGANVLICQKGIDELAQHFLAKENIYAVRRVKKSDMEKLSKATGAKVVSDLNDLSRSDLGFSGLVEEVQVADEYMTYIRNCKNPKALTILIRGATSHIVDEVGRAIEDAIGDINASLEKGKVVAGAGSIEMELAKNVRKYANSLSGREQLAVLKFADSLEVIPRTLAENAGLDPIDVLAGLKSAHDRKEIWAGINVFSGKVIDAKRQGIIEPEKIKSQAITSATEVAVMVLRIDDVILAEKGIDKGMGQPPGPNYDGM